MQPKVANQKSRIVSVAARWVVQKMEQKSKKKKQNNLTKVCHKETEQFNSFRDKNWSKRLQMQSDMGSRGVCVCFYMFFEFHKHTCI